MSFDGDESNAARGEPASVSSSACETRPVSVTLVPARREDAFVLAESMRPKDVRELEACGMTPIQGLLRSLEASQVACTLLYGDVVGAMFGVARLGEALSSEYQFWFLTGHLFAEKPLAFFKASRRLLAELLEHFPSLSNAIDARHDDALRFATAMGAEFGPPFSRGLNGELFVPFVLRSP